MTCSFILSTDINDCVIEFNDLQKKVLSMGHCDNHNQCKGQKQGHNDFIGTQVKHIYVPRKQSTCEPFKQLIIKMWFEGQLGKLEHAK